MTAMMLPLVTITVLAVLPMAAVSVVSFQLVFGIIIPYAAFGILIAGFLWRLISWALSPVPFCIPTVCGQQKSLSWIKYDKSESPWTKWDVAKRMVLEILFFRSLFRNDKTELKRRGKLVYGSSRYLWLASLLFHWSLAVIVFRHLRFITEPVFPGIGFVQSLDGFFQLGTPTLYLTDVLILCSLLFLAMRRIGVSQLRFVSLPQDYFALFLLIAIAGTGILMRVFFHPDLIAIKELLLGLVTFRPHLPSSQISLMAYSHLFLASVLFAYFPFSKLMHAPGVFLSPTRNLRNNSRAKHYVNPWSYPVKVHTYEEYEEEFGEAMVKAGIPVEKEIKHTSDNAG